jgi:hypothetical protein
VQVDVKSQISIIAALQEAESRVIQGRVVSDTPPALEHQQSERMSLTRQTADVAAYE